MKRVLIIGGNGTLGRAMVQVFLPDWEVTNIDLEPNPEAHVNLLVSASQRYEAQASALTQEMKGKYHSIICVAGGFLPGSVESEEVFPQLELMMNANLYPSLLSAHIATKRLEEGGLLVFTGAATPFKSTAPGVLAYAISKTAVHSLALNMATRQSLPSTSTVLTLLPEIIDTPANRVSMPDIDRSKWLDPRAVSALLKTWADGQNRPENGSFAVLKNEGDRVVPEFV